MKIQLLMIIAVVISSLLTISQRASAHEVNQLRWLEPTVEQKFAEVVVPDQDKSSDNTYVALSFFLTKVLASSSPIFSYYHRPIQPRLNGNTSPRAPPFSLI
mgnify:CR=1 FL=1|jgi:DNA phosphorothioation-dependent restriction protein DptG